jgi:hypothetical protein
MQITQEIEYLIMFVISGHDLVLEKIWTFNILTAYKMYKVTRWPAAGYLVNCRLYNDYSYITYKNILFALVLPSLPLHTAKALR